MTPTSLFKKYLWLVEKLSYQSLSKKEIDYQWHKSELNEEHEDEIPRRTFIRMKDAISDLFEIQIEYDRKDGKYYIEKDFDKKSDEIRDYLLSVFAVNQMISDNSDLSDRILLEDTASGSNLFLPEITSAMRDCRCLSITYQSYEMHTAREFEIEPYALRYFGRRWYVLARTDFHDSLRLYALDRMNNVKISDKSFKLPSDFSAEDYFARYFGMIITDGKIENVQLRTTDLRAKYLKSLPLHRTQKEIGTNLFELNLVPTDDFINALRAMGPEIEVVSPDWLRKRLLQDAKDLVKKYSKKK